MSTTPNNISYEHDIAIDETILDVEFLEQPRLFLKYAQHAERSRRDLDWAKERLDIKHAELDRDIRSDPAHFGIAKITEGAVQGAITINSDYQKLSSDYINAKYEAGMAAAAVRAFDQRKTSLENLVRLHGQQYFSGPRVPHDLTEERQRRQDRSNEAMGRAMNRRRTQE